MAFSIGNFQDHFVARCAHLSIAILATCLSTITVHASSTLTLEGHTGLLTIPSADTAEKGTATLQYSDRMFFNNEYEHNNNIIANFGLLDILEVGGRIAWFDTHNNCFNEDCKVRDLSANLKIQIPFIPEDWFTAAIGASDVGGEANFFDTEYLVASKKIGAFELTLGLGNNSTENALTHKHLDGLFGGIKYEATDWLSVLAEYDSNDTNVGISISSPKQWLQGAQVHIKTLLYSDYDSNNGSNQVFFSAGIELPLGNLIATKKHLPPPPATARRLQSSDAKETQHPALQNQNSVPHIASTQILDSTTPTTCALSKLQRQNFDSIQLLDSSGQLSLAFENNTYNTNELDALGVALGILSACATAETQFLQITIKNLNIPIMSVRANKRSYQAFLSGEISTPDIQLIANSDFNAATDSASPFSSMLKPSITLAPSITSGIATEFGTWDYSWSLQSNIGLNLWQGAKLSATYNGFISESEDFERGGPFANDAQQSGWKEYSIQQAFSLPLSLFTNFHIGQIRFDYEGIQNESQWLSPAGKHKLALKLGKFEHRDNGEDQRDYSLGSYRYYLPNTDFSVEATAGQFWEQDEGYTLEGHFRFDDQTITLFYKNTDAEFIGMRWTIPLTPRKDFNHRYFQIKGKENWRYSVQTRINEDSNDLSFTIADVPRFEWEIDRTFFNNDKLNDAYLKANTPRLKDAYLQFAE